jgi:TonB family protein
MLRQLSLAIAAGGLFQSTTGGATPLEPTGKWVVDYRTDQCLASREFGTPDNPVTFGIRPAPDGETYLLLLAQKRPGPDLGKQREGLVDFGHGPIKSWLLEFRDKQSNSDIYQFRISAGEMEQAKTASSIKFSRKNAPDVELQLELMPPLIKSLEDCTADLKRYWNMGGEMDGRILTGSKGDVRQLFSSDDYPAEAYWRSQGGKSQFILLIDETGKVAGCDVVVASGVPALDAMGCQVIRDRAKFTPALGPNGKPVRSTYVTPPVVWQMR